ncbi:MAG TPA: electron transport complex subunit RsxC [Defluviitaleaceae bacterium]|nr:electron transport complex subunit RsxC [Defluviitaleaceae bacterium]
MQLLTFKRGIHPPDGKHLTENKPIEYLLPKGDLVYPMVQHIGAPCEPIVKKGDRVLVGQKIGETKAYVSSPIHSSVSGTVKNIAPMLHPNGNKVLSVIVENDGLYEEHESIGPKGDYKDLSREQIIEIIKEAGIVGMGGAGFPTFIKLSPPPEKKIDTIIVNGAECEPYLTSDYRVMLEETDRVVTGLKIILKLFPEAKGYIAVENNKMKAVEALLEETKNVDNIEVKVLKTKYPQGSEKQLIYALTGREVPSAGLPADVGCIVQNIDTVVAIHRAIVRGRPLMRRIVTVTGGAIKDPKNFKVKIGTSYRELIEAAGGFVEEPVKIISGGPMMGIALPSLDVPVCKGTSAILCLTREEAQLPQEQNCIRCGRCISACPMGLMPLELNRYAIHKDIEQFETMHGMDCMECGSCSYICPAKRHIVQSIRTAKKAVLENRKKNA